MWTQQPSRHEPRSRGAVIVCHGPWVLSLEISILYTAAIFWLLFYYDNIIFLRFNFVAFCNLVSAVRYICIYIYIYVYIYISFSFNLLSPHVPFNHVMTSVPVSVRCSFVMLLPVLFWYLFPFLMYLILLPCLVIPDWFLLCTWLSRSFCSLLCCTVSQPVCSSVLFPLFLVLLCMLESVHIKQIASRLFLPLPLSFLHLGYHLCYIPKYDIVYVFACLCLPRALLLCSPPKS